jgi:hypothetical protein
LAPKYAPGALETEARFVHENDHCLAPPGLFLSEANVPGATRRPTPLRASGYAHWLLDTPAGLAHLLTQVVSIVANAMAFRDQSLNPIQRPTLILVS